MLQDELHKRGNVNSIINKKPSRSGSPAETYNVYFMEVLKMYIRTICVLVENEEGNGFYWGSEYGYEQIIKEAESR